MECFLMGRLVVGLVVAGWSGAGTSVLGWLFAGVCDAGSLLAVGSVAGESAVLWSVVGLLVGWVAVEGPMAWWSANPLLGDVRRGAARRALPWRLAPRRALVEGPAALGFGDCEDAQRERQEADGAGVAVKTGTEIKAVEWQDQRPRGWRLAVSFSVNVVSEAVNDLDSTTYPTTAIVAPLGNQLPHSCLC